MQFTTPTLVVQTPGAASTAQQVAGLTSHEAWG